MNLDSETRDDLVERVARRTVELLEEGGLVSSSRLVDAATLADRLGVERSWVYEHANELGARRLGTGPKGRLRFDVEEAERAVPCVGGRESDEAASRPAKPKQRHRRARRLGTEAPLLPVKGRSG